MSRSLMTSAISDTQLIMFGHNYTQIHVICDNNNNAKTMNKSLRVGQKLRTRLERQKNWRYEVLSNRRFHRSTIWCENRDDVNGYQSDESCDSRSSSVSLDRISLNDILRAIASCERWPECEPILNTAISAVMAQVDNNSSDFDAIQHILNNLFVEDVLNKMSTFIGSKGVRRSLQIKILRMFADLFNNMSFHPLSDQLVHNIIHSLMVPKLIEILVYGSEPLVDRSLNTLLDCLKINSSPLLRHVMDCGFVDVLIVRTDLLRWKTAKVHSSDLKTNRRQLITETNFSPTAKVLLRHFARAVYQLLCLDTDDSLLMAIFNKIVPLLHRLFACPDSKLTTIAINCLEMLASKGGQQYCSVIVQSFSRTLFSLMEKMDDSIVFPALKMLNILIYSCPQLFTYQSFGSHLIHTLETIVKQNRNDTNDKEIIGIMSSISQWLVMDSEPMRQLSDRMIYLSLVVFNSTNDYNRLIAVQTIETILCKYSFEWFVQLLAVFDIRDLIKQLMVSNEKHQEIGLNICTHILDILNNSFHTFGEDTENVRHLLFGKSTDIYFYLEKLSYKLFDTKITARAQCLLQQIEDKPTVNDEDLTVVPPFNQSGFIFGPNVW